jgi:hypothetical protein
MDSSKNWREALYVIIFQSDTPAGRRFDSILLLIIGFSLRNWLTPCAANNCNTIARPARKTVTNMAQHFAPAVAMHCSRNWNKQSAF